MNGKLLIKDYTKVKYKLKTERTRKNESENFVLSGRTKEKCHTLTLKCETGAPLQFSTQYLISTAILDISDYISGIHKLNLLTTL